MLSSALLTLLALFQGPVHAEARLEPPAPAPGALAEIHVVLQIQDGWHVYHPDQDPASGIPVSAKLESAVLEAAGPLRSLQEGQPHDEVIGAKTYDYLWLSGRAELVLPVRVTGAAGPGAATLQLTTQACTERNCNLPETEPLALAFTIAAPAEPAQPAATPPAPLQLPGGFGAREESDPDAIVSWSATVEPASARPGDAVEVRLKARIRDGWHLYHPTMDPSLGIPVQIEKLGGALAEKPGAALESLQPPTPHEEKIGAETLHYLWLSGEVELRVPAWVAGGEGPARGTIAVRWQTCNDRVCLPPRVTNLTVPITLLAGGTVAPAPAPAAGDGGGTGAARPGAVSGAQKSLDQGLWAFLLAAIGAALVSLATPCVFPMIPITVSFFTKRAESGKGTALGNASAYGVGIVFTFVGLGMGVTALLGAGGANQIASSVWVNVLLSLLFLVFALSLIGFFDINPPQWLQQRLARGQAAGQGKGGYLPVMLMAVAFSVTAFTCTVGFVGALLALAAGSGEWTYALFGMSVYAIVFAAPFFLLALFPSALKRLPRAGGWMNTLKVSMGFLELIAAWKFLSNADMALDLHVLTRPVIIVLTVVPLALLGLYLFGAFRTPHDYEKARLTPLRLLLGGGTLVLAGYIGLGLRGGPFGGVIEAYFPPPQYGQAYEAEGSRILGPVGLEWFENYQEARAVAVEEKKPLFLDFTGVTCVNCRRMEGNIFPAEQVKPLFEKYVRAELWVDKGEWAEFNKKLQLDWFHTQAQPFYALLDPRTETVLAIYPGYDPDPARFAAFLRGGLEKYR